MNSTRFAEKVLIPMLSFKNFEGRNSYLKTVLESWISGQKLTVASSASWFFCPSKFQLAGENSFWVVVKQNATCCVIDLGQLHCVLVETYIQGYIFWPFPPIFFVPIEKQGRIWRRTWKKEGKRGGKKKKRQKSDKTHVKIPLWSLDDRNGLSTV